MIQRLFLVTSVSLFGCSSSSVLNPHDGGADFSTVAMSDMTVARDLLPPPPPRARVLTQHNDSGRTGANLLETVLTPAKVKAGFGLERMLAVDDEVYAQPLFVPDLMVSGRGVHD